MALTKYIAPGEKILLTFRMSMRWYILMNLFSAILLGVPGWYFWSELSATPIFILPYFIALGMTHFFLFLFYLSTIYFITNRKIYRRIGILWIKVTSINIKEITDIIVEQGILENLMYDMGTLKINTAGTPEYEIIMTRVGDPFAKKRKVYELFQNQ